MRHGVYLVPLSVPLSVENGVIQFPGPLQNKVICEI